MIRNSSIDLEALAQHSASRVRSIVAADPATPPDLLRTLALDGDVSVKLAAALNPACPIDILNALCADSTPAIRFGLASQLDINDEILTALVTHRNPYLANQARYGLCSALFERKIKQLEIVIIPSSEHKLGTLLVASKHLTQVELSDGLDSARKFNLRLGRILLQTETVRPSILIEALRLQALLRKHQIELREAVDSLTGNQCNHFEGCQFLG